MTKIACTTVLLLVNFNQVSSEHKQIYRFEMIQHLKVITGSSANG